MTENPDDHRLTEEERDADRRFQETLGRLVNTPHKPHKKEAPKRPPAARPRS